jgi:hypothetical protein
MARTNEFYEEVLAKHFSNAVNSKDESFTVGNYLCGSRATVQFDGATLVIALGEQKSEGSWFQNGDCKDFDDGFGRYERKWQI